MVRSLEASGVLVAAVLEEEALAPAIDAFQLRYALISSCYEKVAPEGHRLTKQIHLTCAKNGSTHEN